MSMIERVARNIRRKFNIRNFDRDDDTGWEADMDDARAAIEAMREPTEEMIADGFGTGEFENDAAFAEPEMARAVYTAMIDRALSKAAERSG